MTEDGKKTILKAELDFQKKATTDQAETVLSIFSEESIQKLQTESYLLCFTKG